MTEGKDMGDNSSKKENLYDKCRDALFYYIL